MGNTQTVAYADRELATASEKGNLPRVKFLVEKDGANVDLQDNFGWSPLLHAISEGHLDVIRYLLSKGATTTHLTSDRANAIHHAVTSQNDSVLLFLLQYGTCDVNGKNDGGWTPLHLACLGNQYQAVKALLACKADVSLVNGEGKGAIQITTSSAIKNLLQRGPGKLEEISPEEEVYRNKGMQKSLKQLQDMQNRPNTPVEMKGRGYMYLSNQPDSTEDLLTITTTSNYNNKNKNKNNNDNNNNNNNNNNSSDEETTSKYKKDDKTISGEALIEREYERIFDAIHVLRGVDAENLNMAQIQELIVFHREQTEKFAAAKKIMEDIRTKELEQLMAE